MYRVRYRFGISPLGICLFPSLVCNLISAGEEKNRYQTPEIVQWQTIMFFMSIQLLCLNDPLHNINRIYVQTKNAAYTHNVEHFNYIFIIS